MENTEQMTRRGFFSHIYNMLCGEDDKQEQEQLDKWEREEQTLYKERLDELCELLNRFDTQPVTGGIAKKTHTIKPDGTVAVEWSTVALDCDLSVRYLPSEQQLLVYTFQAKDSKLPAFNLYPVHHTTTVDGRLFVFIGTKEATDGTAD